MGQERKARDVHERRELSSRDDGADALPIVLIEERSDHREVLADELEGASLGHPLVALSSASALPDEAGVIVASMACRAEKVVPWIQDLMSRSPQPGLVFVSGPEDAWAEEAERRWPSAPRLDKRKGLAFLRALSSAVEGALGSRGVEGPLPVEARDDPPGPPPSADPAPDSTGADDAAPTQEDQAPVASLAFQERVRRELLLAGILAGEVESLLGRLDSLAELFRHRVPGDPAIDRYASCLADEVQRGRALSARITSLAFDAHASGARLMAPADLVKLRVAAWRRWLPEDSAIQIHIDAHAPRVAVWPEVLGPLLDEIVGVVVRAENEGPQLSLRVDAAFRETLRETPRWARLELSGGHALQPGLLPREDLDALLERARTVMAAHGGEVEHSGLDAPGARPRVALLLPEAAAGSIDDARPERSEADARSATGTSATSESHVASVLIVDDDESIRDIASEMLQVVGHHPRSVSSGEAAVELYEGGERFDLVLLDMQMTGMDGRRTFNALRRLDPQLRAILVSGSATGTEIRTLLSEGLLGFLPKPFSVAKLKEVVESALREI